MSETVSTVIKVISALTSPTLALKFILIALFLVIFSIYLPPYLAAHGVVGDYSYTAIIFAGCGVGSLIGSLFSYLINRCNKAYGLSQKDKSDQKAAAKKLEEQERKDRSYIEEFKVVFRHYDYNTRSILRELSIKDTVYCIVEGHPPRKDSRISLLSGAGYIQSKGMISNDRALFAINSLIREYISAQWQEEIETNINEFFSTTTAFKTFIIKACESERPNLYRLIDYDTFKKERYSIECCFNFYNADRESVYVEFKPGYHEVFSNRLSREFDEDEFEIFFIES